MWVKQHYLLKTYFHIFSDKSVMTDVKILSLMVGKHLLVSHKRKTEREGHRREAAQSVMVKMGPGQMHTCHGHHIYEHGTLMSSHKSYNENTWNEATMISTNPIMGVIAFLWWYFKFHMLAYFPFSTCNQCTYLFFLFILETIFCPLWFERIGSKDWRLELEQTKKGLNSLGGVLSPSVYKLVRSLEVVLQQVTVVSLAL